MYKFKRSQILLSAIVASLLTITPLLSSSLRPTYLYFIFNLLVIALGAESGLLSSLLSNPNPINPNNPNPSTPNNPTFDDKKLFATPNSPTNYNNSGEDRDVSAGTNKSNVVIADQETKKPNKVVEKRNFEKIASVSRGLKVNIARVKRCPSTPSIFFIGGGEKNPPEATPEENDGGVEEEEVGISSQELFNEAESFIGNFYKQLKMQREESWKKIHGFYQKAF